MDLADLVRAVTRGRALRVGALALILAGAAAGFSWRARPEIALDAAAIEAVRDRWIADRGRPPNAAELAHAVDAAVDEEVLWREALRLGVYRADPLVKRRIAQLGQEVSGVWDRVDWGFVESALASGFAKGDAIVRARMVDAVKRWLAASSREPEPDDAAMALYLEVNAARFTTPAQVRFTQVYVDPARRDAAAIGALAERIALLAPTDAAALGDPFLLDAAQGPASGAEIAKRFGPAFARALEDLPARRWQGPIRSAFGLHFVWIEDREPPRLPPLDLVRGAVRRAMAHEREEAAVREGIRRLRARYRVEVSAFPPPS